MIDVIDADALPMRGPEAVATPELLAARDEAVAAAASANPIAIAKGIAGSILIGFGQVPLQLGAASPVDGPAANAGYALIDLGSRNTGATRPITQIVGNAKVAGAFDIQITAQTPIDGTYKVLDRWTVTVPAGAFTLVPSRDFDPRAFPSGAYSGVILPATGGAPSIAAGGDWAYHAGDPGAAATAYGGTYASQLQIRIDLQPSAADIADAQTADAQSLARSAALAAVAMAGITSETLGPAIFGNPGIPSVAGTASRLIVMGQPTRGGWSRQRRIFIVDVRGPAPTIDLLWMKPVGVHNAMVVFWRQTFPVKAGLNIFEVGRDFDPVYIPHGCLRGYLVSTSAVDGSRALPAGDPASTEGNWYVDNADPGAPGTGTVITPTYAAGYGQMITDVLLSEPETVPAASSGASVLLDSGAFAGAQMPAGWTAPGWTVNNGLISPTSGQGYGQIAYSDKMFALDRRVTSVDFRFLAAGSYFAASWRSAGTDLISGGRECSMAAVDMAANQLIMKNTFADGATTDPGNAATIAVPWTLTVARPYRLVMEIKRRRNTYTLIDLVTGASVSIGDGQYIDFLANTVNYNVSTGEQIGTLCFHAVAGQVQIGDGQQGYRIRAIGGRPAVWVAGDSLGEGFGVPEQRRWMARLRAELERRGEWVAISALTADMTGGGLKRAQSEMVKLQPAVAILAQGTNDQDGRLAAYQANVNAFLALCDANGILPVIMVPGPFSTQSYAQIKAWLLTLGRRLLRTDLAITVNSDGATPSVPLFLYDGDEAYHPGHWNVDGHEAVYRRALIDVPELAA